MAPSHAAEIAPALERYLADPDRLQYVILVVEGAERIYAQFILNVDGLLGELVGPDPRPCAHGAPEAAGSR